MNGSSSIVARAPVRISLAGEATGLDPYYVPFGGFSVNVAIDRYCYVMAGTPSDGVTHVSADTCRGCEREIATLRDGESERLAHAAIARFRGAGLDKRGVDLYLTTDVPPGSGLGSSSAMAVALVGALGAYLGRAVDTGAIAELAASVALTCLGSSIGKQDPYASAYGGCTTVDTGAETTSAHTLDLRADVRQELTERLLLFWTGQSRDRTQISSSQAGNSGAGLLATRWLHEQKALAEEMRQSLVDGDFDLVGRLLDLSWHYKKELFPVVTTDEIDGWYDRARDAGAVGGKLTGAGGGFLLLYTPPEARRSVRAAMSDAGLREMRFSFDDEGVTILPGLGEDGDRTRLARSTLSRRRSVERAIAASYSQ